MPFFQAMAARRSTGRCNRLPVPGTCRMIGGMAGGMMKQAIFKASTALAVLGMAIPAGAQSDRAPAVQTEPAAQMDAAKAAALAEAMRASEFWIEGQRRYRNIPAISAAVALGDRTVWAKGFGATDRGQDKPATPETIYSICSISKLFTAVALMQQWE